METLAAMETMYGKSYKQSESSFLPPERIVFVSLLFLAIIALVTSAVLIERHLTYKRRVLESARARLTSLTFQASRSIDGITREVISNVNSIAGELSEGQLTHDKALIRIRELLERHPHFLGAALAYRPYAFDPNRRLYSTYLVNKTDKIELLRIEDMYDYTKPQYEWFSGAIERGPIWTQPYYCVVGKALMVTYTVPFFGMRPTDGEHPVSGVVTIDLSMKSIQQIIESLDLGPTGFGALVSQRGVYLYHPDTELVVDRKTLADTGRELADRDRLLLAAKVGKREVGIVDHRSASTGLDAWLIYAPIPSTGWSLHNTFIKDDLPWDVDLMRRRLMGITCGLVIFASLTVALLFRVYGGSRKRLWAASSAIAVLLATGIGFLWKVSLDYDSFSGNEGIRVGDKATLLRVMNSFSRASGDRHTEAPIYIPTGVFVESASLTNAGDLSLSGYLWQKYRLDSQGSIPRGFTIGGASALEKTENCRIREKGFEVVRWSFRCTVPQRINHRKYPLEQLQLSLCIHHRERNHNVFLVPDLASYRFTSQTALPGLRKGLVLPGWKISRSFFELSNERYDTDFGLARPLTKETFPSFQFSIVVRRIFIDAFITNLTALIIVTILLFVLLMITGRGDRMEGFMQAASGKIINICTGMFFVIALTHVDIRRKIAAEQVFYLECFYIVIYLAILGVSINSVLFAAGVGNRFIQYRQNLLPKLLFWPLLIAILFMITIFTFY